MSWGVIGHSWAVEMLQRHQSAGRVRHAYLFTGPARIGKRTLAKRFAMSLNCYTTAADEAPCGQCRACRLIEVERYADLHILERGPEETQIKIDAVRQLQRALSLSAIEARWRVALLVDFQEASPEAQNALLKTLEEPAAGVVLLLTARQGEDLLPTIVSRCEVLGLRPVAKGEIEGALMGRGVEAEDARLLAALAGGRPGEALRLAADPARLSERREQVEDLRTLLEASRAKRFAYVAEKVGSRRTIDLEGKRRETSELLETWLGLLRDALIVAEGAEAGLLNPDQREWLERLAAGAGQSGVLAAVEATERTLEAVHRNANLQLAMETLLLDLPRLGAASAGVGSRG